jgi:hypothetical protein
VHGPRGHGQTAADRTLAQSRRIEIPAGAEFKILSA